jgi:diguanylate cyclase (GGDEF)-like protein
MLDLCRFKEVNDTLGHNVGDRVLCEVAQRFQAALGADGFIARIGGDEVTVVLDAAQLEKGGDGSIVTATQALADSLRAPIDVAGICLEVGVSIGVARYPDDAPDVQALLRHADVAMYVAKRRGIAWEYYDATHDENTVRRLSIGGELRAAIANDQLELHFQPQVNLRSGLVESAEALVRWHHPAQGEVSPAEFVAIAESTDLIRPLTEWTLNHALTQIRAWRDRGVHVRIAVNLSARILQDTAFPARLASLLEAAGVSAASLELVAEGVETEWDAQFLKAAGYDFAQGFHFARALPVDKCMAWIVEFNATAMLTAGDTTVTRTVHEHAKPGRDVRSPRSRTARS